MIHGMNRRLTILIAPLFLWFALALNAPRNAQSLVESDFQSTPTLKVFVYSFPGLPPSLLQGAESEAARVLRPVPIQWSWIDCTGRLMPAPCQSPQLSTDLVIRLTRKALPQVSARTLGIAGSSAEYATAFLFYDRVLALRTQTRFLPAMLGRVLAHEITHLLLPQEDHAELGLMRGHWSGEDLQGTSTACLGLSVRSVQLMQGEALRRVRATHRVREPSGGGPILSKGGGKQRPKW
jgi:hypothetical protein